MKILVTGGSGIIGSKFVKFFQDSGHTVHYTFLNNEHQIGSATAHKLDISDRLLTMDLIKKISPDIVVHTSALTNVDLCETDHSIADKINIEGTRNVVDGCKEAGSKIVYISTSFVFDGTKEIFFEDDERNSVDYYGHTKLRGEEITESAGIPFLILRTDQPYTNVEPWQKKNSVIRVLEKFEKGEIVRELIDWWNTPTYVENFMEVAGELIKRNKEGIYNIIGSDFLSRYQWAFKIAEIFGKDKNMIQEMSSSELNLPAKRANVHLDNTKAQKDTGIKLLGVEEGMKLMRLQMEANK